MKCKMFDKALGEITELSIQLVILTFKWEKS